LAVLPISEKYEDYANEIYLRLQEKDLRGYVDHRDEKIGRKIRDAEVNKVPFMIIVGEKEQAEGLVSIRKKGQGDLGSMSIDAFISVAQEEIQQLTYETFNK
jgi:threonyl-tRNA synthetase